MDAGKRGGRDWAAFPAFALRVEPQVRLAASRINRGRKVMPIRKLTKAETEALLFEMADNRDCANSCRCPFCREFWMGVESGKHDAELELRSALDKLTNGLGRR